MQIQTTEEIDMTAETKHFVVEGYENVLQYINRPGTESYVAVAGHLEYAVKLTRNEARMLVQYANRNDATCQGACWEDSVMHNGKVLRKTAMITLWFVDNDANP